VQGETISLSPRHQRIDSLLAPPPPRMNETGFRRPAAGGVHGDALYRLLCPKQMYRPARPCADFIAAFSSRLIRTPLTSRGFRRPAVGGTLPWFGARAASSNDRTLPVRIGGFYSLDFVGSGRDKIKIRPLNLSGVIHACPPVLPGIATRVKRCWCNFPRPKSSRSSVTHHGPTACVCSCRPPG